MTLPNNPEGWAIHLSKLLKTIQEIQGDNRFPVNVSSIAHEYSKQVFPENPITMIRGEQMKNFEGALIPSPHKKGEWGIIYNENITSPGRKNFTLAHELGHYLLHRHLSTDGIQCTTRQMMDWKSVFGQIETQANTFASFLLMPLDDFRTQIKDHKPSMELMVHLADRYAVSKSAAILKWLDITDKRAMIVVGKEGYIDWAWSSERLLKSGIFYKARQETIEIPPNSLAARRDLSVDNMQGVLHPKGVWIGNEEVHEMTIFSKEDDITTSLLLYPNGAPRFSEIEEPELDTYEKMMKKII